MIWHHLQPLKKIEEKQQDYQAQQTKLKELQRQNEIENDRNQILKENSKLTVQLKKEQERETRKLASQLQKHSEQDEKTIRDAMQMLETQNDEIASQMQKISDLEKTISDYVDEFESAVDDAENNAPAFFQTLLQQIKQLEQELEKSVQEKNALQNQIREIEARHDQSDSASSHDGYFEDSNSDRSGIQHVTELVNTRQPDIPVNKFLQIFSDFLFHRARFNLEKLKSMADTMADTESVDPDLLFQKNEIMSLKDPSQSRNKILESISEQGFIIENEIGEPNNKLSIVIPATENDEQSANLLNAMLEALDQEALGHPYILHEK